MEQEIGKHRAVVDGYVETARAVAPERWRQPPAPGKWTPAQITDHLVRTYSLLTAEIGGAGGARVVTGPVRRSLLRLLVLPWIMRNERLPRGAKAPREIRPDLIAVLAKQDAEPGLPMDAAMDNTGMRWLAGFLAEQLAPA